MFKNEKITPDFEKNEKIKIFYERNKKVIEKLLEEEKNKLGEGMTAEVHFLDSNEEVCLKILKSADDLPFYIPLEKEMGFMSELQDLDEEVRVPKPYLTADYSGNEDDTAIKFLLMERLNAVSIKDVLEGTGKLPLEFDLKDFRKKISAFLEKMHEKNIYHRDLHGGNIMIDNETGDLYVIDFGASTKSFGDEDPYKQVLAIDTKIYTSDENKLTEVCNLIRNYRDEFDK